MIKDLYCHVFCNNNSNMYNSKINIIVKQNEGERENNKIYKQNRFH